MCDLITLGRVDKHLNPDRKHTKRSHWKGLLARVVDLDLLVDVTEDGLHLVLQTVQLASFSLQALLVLLVALLQLCGWMGGRMDGWI